MSNKDTLYKIANALDRIAMHDSYYGNALQVAHSLPMVNIEEKLLIDRWIIGSQTANDAFALMDLAIKLRG